MGLLAVARDLGRDAGRVGAPATAQPAGDLAVQRDPPRRHELLAQDRRVEAVREAVADGQRAVGQRLFPRRDHEAADAGEPLEVLLHVPLRPREELGDDGAQELAAGDARDLQDLALAGAEAVELPPHEVAQARGRLEVDRLERAREAEDGVGSPDVAALDEDVDQAADEEREPLGARVHGGGQLGRERVAGEPGVEILGDLVRGERAEGELAGRAARPQVERALAQAGVVRLHLAQPQRRDEERALADEALPHVVEQVRAGRVRPLHVLDDEQGRIRPARGVHEVARLADQALLGRAERLSAQRAVGVREDARGHLHRDRRRVGAQQHGGPLPRPARQQSRERFEEGQERLGRADRLVAAAAGDRDRPGRGPHPPHELVDERALARAAVAGHEDDPAGSRHRRGHPLVEPGELGLAPHEDLAGGAPGVPSRRPRSRAQRVRELAGGGEALRGLLRERAADERVERDELGRALERRGILVESRREDRRRAVAGEDAPAGQGLVEQRPRGEEVGPRVDRVAEDLLGRHVARRSHDEAGSRELSARVGARDGLAGRLVREAEVDESPAVRGEEEVRRLHVAVDDARVVQRGEGLEQVEGQRDRLFGGQRPALQPRRQGLAGEQLHDDVGLGVVLADLVDRAEVRVAHPGGGPRLAQEAAARRVVGALQDLERDVPAERLVLGEVHSAHAALADDPHDPVASEALSGRQARRAYRRARRIVATQ